MVYTEQSHLSQMIIKEAKENELGIALIYGEVDDEMEAHLSKEGNLHKNAKDTFDWIFWRWDKRGYNLHRAKIHESEKDICRRIPSKAFWRYVNTHFEADELLKAWYLFVLYERETK